MHGWDDKERLKNPPPWPDDNLDKVIRQQLSRQGLAKATGQSH
jgi:hypothetical protein